MGLPRFTCSKGRDDESSLHLYVANCGPAVGLSYEIIASVFGTYGEVKGVYAADESGTRVIVSCQEKGSAQCALEELNGKPCSSLGGRSLYIPYSVQSLHKLQIYIPGLFLIHDFITAKEEEELLSAVDCRPRKHLGKRRVQHYGYEFCYDIRNVNRNQYLGELPDFVSQTLERIRSFQTLECYWCLSRSTNGKE